MTHDDELRSRMSRLAEQNEIGTVTLEQVQARGRRRTLYQRGGVVLAAFAVAVGGALTVASIGGDDGETDLATEEITESQTADDEQPGDDVADEAATEIAPDTTTTAPPAVATESSAADLAFGGDYYGGPSQIVAWNGGFVAFGSRFVPPEPIDVTAEGFEGEIAERFPPEILEVVEASGATTIEESMAALEEAGLLELATEVVTADPELLQWYSDHFTGTQETFFEFSANGVDWEPVVGSLPVVGWVSNIGSSGEHLVIVESNTSYSEADGSQNSVVVWITTDLQNWTSVPLDLAPPTVAPYVQLSISPGQLGVGDDGWYLPIVTSQWIDLWELLPADVRDEVGNGGYGWSPSEEGIRVESWGDYATTDDGGADLPAADYPTVSPTTTTTVPADDTAASASGSAIELADEGIYEYEEPTLVRIVPWSDLPISYDEYQSFNYNNDGSDQAFIGDFAGNVQAAGVPVPGQHSQITTTDAGFVAITSIYPTYDEEGIAEEGDWVGPEVVGHFSPDGVNWTSIDLPISSDDQAWVESVVAVGDGVLLLAGARDGQVMWRGNADGSNFQAVPEPEGLEGIHLWFNTMGSSGDGIATVIDRGTYAPPDFVAWEASFSHDGNGYVVSSDGQGNQTVVVTDADGTTLLDRTTSLYDGLAYQYGDEAIEFRNDDGETVASVPYEVAEQEIFQIESQAWEAQWEANPYVADFVLVATTNGLDWTVIELPAVDDEYGWYGAVAVSGDIVVVQNGENNWTTYSLG